MKEAVRNRRVPKRCEGPNVGVGSVGKVKILMMQELEYYVSSSKTEPINGVSVSLDCLEPRKRTEKAIRKAKSDYKISDRKKKVGQVLPSSHRVPMLASEDIALERSPIPIRAGETGRRRSQLVEMVDLKCENRLGKRLSSDPISNQIRKLRFSKLSS